MNIRTCKLAEISGKDFSNNKVELRVTGVSACTALLILQKKSVIVICDK